MKPRKWTLEKLVEEASKYETLKDFRLNSEGAYKAYVKQGKPQEVSSVFKHFRGYWTEETAKLEAQKYKSRWEFQKNSGGAYRFLWKADLLSDVFGPYEIRSWCEDTVREAALGVPDRTTFKREFAGAHKFAYENNLLDELFGETYNTPCCDNNVVYIWRPKGYKKVYKIGITSDRLKDSRVKYVSKKSGLEVEEVIYLKVSNARELEARILSENKPYGFFPSFSGSTEFRVIPDVSIYEKVGN